MLHVPRENKDIYKFIIKIHIETDFFSATIISEIP